MPFSDPMADGPVIQEAGQRALKQGMNLRRTLALVRELRRADEATPIVLMGYYNPIYRYGAEDFRARCRRCRGRRGHRRRLTPRGGCRADRAGACCRSRFRAPRDPDQRRAAPAAHRQPRQRLYLLRCDRRHHRHPLRRFRQRRRRGHPDCAATPHCRLQSASASGPPSRPPRSRAPPMPPSSARRSSSASPSTSIPMATAKPGLVDAVLGDVRALAAGVGGARK